MPKKTTPRPNLSTLTREETWLLHVYRGLPRAAQIRLVDTATEAAMMDGPADDLKAANQWSRDVARQLSGGAR